jgi:hypothetical protein
MFCPTPIYLDILTALTILIRNAVPTTTIAARFKRLPNLYLGFLGRDIVSANVVVVVATNKIINNTFFIIFIYLVDVNIKSGF